MTWNFDPIFTILKGLLSSWMILKFPFEVGLKFFVLILVGSSNSLCKEFSLSHTSRLDTFVVWWHSSRSFSWTMVVVVTLFIFAYSIRRSPRMFVLIMINMLHLSWYFSTSNALETWSRLVRLGMGILRYRCMHFHMGSRRSKHLPPFLHFLILR